VASYLDELNETLPIEILSLLAGKLLGDANLKAPQGRKSSRLYFSHSYSDKEWCQYCYDRINPFLPLPSPKYSRITDPRLTRGYFEKYYVQSRTHRAFYLLRILWYPTDTKTVPFELLERHLTSEALAWWYQDDGHLKLENGIPRKVILSTDSFTKTENYKLIDLIKSKFNLSFKLDGQNRLLLYDQQQLIYFLHLVKPYIHGSMSRKLIPPYKNKHFPKPLRTTIYIPNHITIIKPTEEISDILSILPHILNTLMNPTKFEALYKNYFPFINNAGETTGYQIRLNPTILEQIHRCKYFSGLTNSQLSHLC